MFEIIFNQKLSEFEIYITNNVNLMNSSIVGCSYLLDNSVYINVDEFLYIIRSTGKNKIVHDNQIETIPLYIEYTNEEDNTNMIISSDQNNINKKVVIKTIYWGLKAYLTSCGNLIKFLKHNLNIIRNENKIDEYIDEELNFRYYESPKNLYFIPSLFGLRFPYNRKNAFISIYGLNSKHSSRDIIKSAIEGICLTINDLLVHFNKICNDSSSMIFLGGSYSFSRAMIQFLCNIIQKSIYKHRSLPYI